MFRNFHYPSVLYILDANSVESHHPLEQSLPDVPYRTIGLVCHKSSCKSKWARVSPLIFTLCKIQGQRSFQRVQRFFLAPFGVIILSVVNLRDFLSRATASSKVLVEIFWVSGQRVLGGLWQNETAEVRLLRKAQTANQNSPQHVSLGIDIARFFFPSMKQSLAFYSQVSQINAGFWNA